jgi:nucleotide-binding universal stress UspA family protein
MLPDIKRILYATDLGSGAHQVFRYALKIAQQQHAEITILHAQEPLSAFAQSLVELHVAHDDSEMMHEEAREKVRQMIEQRLNELCESEQCQDKNGRELVTDIAVVEGQPAEKILDKAAEVNADLIVIGSHRHSAIGETLIGSTTNRVLHRSATPVLVVRIPGKTRQ